METPIHQFLPTQTNPPHLNPTVRTTAVTVENARTRAVAPVTTDMDLDLSAARVERVSTATVLLDPTTSTPTVMVTVTVTAMATTVPALLAGDPDIMRCTQWVNMDMDMDPTLVLTASQAITATTVVLSDSDLVVTEAQVVASTEDRLEVPVVPEVHSTFCARSVPV
jgi:hypothetical protein